MTKEPFKYFLALGVLLSFITLSPWVLAEKPGGTPPDCPAANPGCNVPLNVGGEAQSKTGGLSIRGLLVFPKAGESVKGGEIGLTGGAGKTAYVYNSGGNLILQNEDLEKFTDIFGKFRIRQCLDGTCSSQTPIKVGDVLTAVDTAGTAKWKTSAASLTEASFYTVREGYKCLTEYKATGACVNTATCDPGDVAVGGGTVGLDNSGKVAAAFPGKLIGNYKSIDSYDVSVKNMWTCYSVGDGVNTCFARCLDLAPLRQ